MSNAPLQQRAAVATRQYSNASQQQRATRLPVFLPLSHLLIFPSHQSSLTLHDSFCYPCSSLIFCDHRLRADGSIYFCSFLSGASASSSRSEHGFHIPHSYFHTFHIRTFHSHLHSTFSPFVHSTFHIPHTYIPPTFVHSWDGFGSQCSVSRGRPDQMFWTVWSAFWIRLFWRVWMLFGS